MIWQSQVMRTGVYSYGMCQEVNIVFYFIRMVGMSLEKSFGLQSYPVEQCIAELLYNMKTQLLVNVTD